MKDIVILKFECESNLNDTKDTLELSRQVAEHLKSFKGLTKLTNIGVEYRYNPQQRAKQTPEFLKNNPDWLKKEEAYLKSVEGKVREEPKDNRVVEKKSMQDIQSDFYAQDTWKEVKHKKNGKREFTKESFDDYVDNPNRK